MIYFIQAETSRAIKIGKANDPEQRLTTPQTAAHERLLLLGVVRGDALFERRLHAILARHRVRGEWFRPDPEVLLAIDVLLASSDLRPIRGSLARLFTQEPPEALPPAPGRVSRRDRAAEFLKARFREKHEWRSDELFELARGHGIGRNAIFEAKELIRLPKPTMRTGPDGVRFWVWFGPVWPSG